MGGRSTKPLIRKVDALEIPVPSLEEGLAFYRDRLGHELIWRTQTAAGLRLPDTDAELVLQTDLTGLGLSPDAARDPAVLFFHDVPDEITAEAIGREPYQSSRPFSEPWPLSRWPGVPTRVLIGRHDRLFPAEFQRRVAPASGSASPRTRSTVATSSH